VLFGDVFIANSQHGGTAGKKADIRIVGLTQFSGLKVGQNPYTCYGYYSGIETVENGWRSEPPKYRD